MRLPRRQPRSVYAVYDSEEPADGDLASDPLEDLPGAFERDLGAASRHSASIDSEIRPAAKPRRASAGTSTGRVIGGVLAGVGAACALAMLAIALLGLASGGASDGGVSDGGASTSTRPDRRLGASGRLAPAPRTLRSAAPRPGGDVRDGAAAGAARPRKRSRAVPSIAALRSHSIPAVAGSASAPRPICGCLIAEIEFGFER